MRIPLARARSRTAQLIAIGATAAVLAGVGVAMAGVLESGLDAAVRAAATESDATVIVAGESASAVEASVRVAFAGLPVTVTDVDGAAVIAPDAGRVGTGDLPGLRDGVARLADALVDEAVASRTAVSGGMSAWAQDLIDLSWNARLLALVPFLVVAVGGLVAARDVVRVLALSRIAELAVVRSRGASVRRILAGELREIGAVGSVGALVGAAVASPVAGTPPLLALVVVAVVVAAFALVTIPVVRAATPRDRAGEAAASSGRARAGGLVGLAVLFAATALALVRLIGASSGGDPLGVTAPALGLLTAAVLVLAAVAAVARLGDLATPRWVGFGPSLAIRRLARRVPVLATVVLLVAIAASTTVFAAAFAATGERVAGDVRALRIGGDLLIDSWPEDADPDGLPADGVAPLLSSSGELGDDAPLILAAPAERLRAALHATTGLVDPGALADLVAAPVAGIVLPEGTTELEFVVEATDGVALQVWLLEPSGRVRVAALDRIVTGESSAILAIDADVSRAGGAISARITSLVASTPRGIEPVELPADWEPQFAAYPDFVGARFAMTEDALGFELGRRSTAENNVRLMAPGEPATRIPAVVTTDLAVRNGLGVGDEVDVRFTGTGRSVLGLVSGTVPGLPIAGDADAILVDYPAFAEQQLRLTESVPATSALVIRSDDPQAVRDGLPSGAGVTGLEPGTPDRMLGIARTLLWVAAAGAVALAAVGVASVSAALVAERRRETRILTVLGETPRRQARGQRLELAAAMTLSAVGGVASGAALAAVTVPGFARSAAPGSGVLAGVELAVDIPSGAVLLIVLVALLGVVLVIHGLRVARDAARPTGGAS
jgi:hypothetical protein